MIHFQYIENLLALTAIPVMLLIFFLLLRWKKKAIQKIGDERLVKQLFSGFSSKLFAFKFLLIVAAFLLGVLAIAGLVKPEGSQITNRKGIDVMIALDVSNSMMADDIKPNRLERAKQIVTKIIDRLNDNRIGIVIFAGRAYVQMPMTADHSSAKMYLSAISPDDIPTQGTVIGDALNVCYTAFNIKEKKYRSIILISDGEDHDEDAIKISKQLAQEGVMINTIGIGSPQGGLIPDKETNDYKKDESGNPVISRLNEDVLKAIAQNANGIYQLFTSTDEVADNVQKKLSGLGQTNLTDKTFVNYKYYFWYFLSAALLLLLIEFFIPEKKNISRQAIMRSSAMLIALLLQGNVSFAQQVNKEIIKGNQAYNRNQFDSASVLYQRALQMAPGNNIASYNLGNALYKTNKPEDAVKLYDNVIRSSSEREYKQKGYYNKGVAFQKQNKLPECIDAYKHALKLDPTDEEARQNLQRALAQLKQQEKKPEEQKNNRQNKNDEQKKDQQPKPQPSKITKSDAEEKLKSLLEHEKNLQEKLRKVKTAAPDQPKKDW
ncbi:MAG: VWA domain-containing protein [Ginsengibacter sp.]